MKRIINTAIVYFIFAMAGGVFYREFTKWNGYTEPTTLGVLHVHLLVMGTLLFLITALFAKVTMLAENLLFKKFFVLYNIALPAMVVTDAKTGKALYKKVDRCDKTEMEWMRASASMPIVSKPVCVDGYELLDGGVADSIPVQKMQELGFDKTVVVLTQPRDYVKKKNQLMPLAKVSLRRYPAMIDAMEHRHEHYNEELEYIRGKEERGELFVIRPPKKIEVSKVERDRQRLLAAYRMGRETMKEHMRSLERFLK